MFRNRTNPLFCALTIEPASRSGPTTDAVDGDVTFGETTMKMETIEELCSKWKTIGYDRSLQDPYQLIVLLQARGAA